MSTSPIIDIGSIVRELRLAVEYASRAGLLQDKEVIATLQAAEESLGHDGEPDVHVLTMALNDVMKVIAPITLADLRFGRDPFSPSNQTRSKAQQFVITIFALVVLGLIGYFMQALRVEQGALVSLTGLQESKPQLKLTALRKLAQYEEPMLKPSALYDKYHNELVELRQVNGNINSTYLEAVAADNIPLFPGGSIFRSISPTVTPPSPIGPKEGSPGKAVAIPPATEAKAQGIAFNGADKVGPAPALPPPIPQTADGHSQFSDAEDFCAEDSSGYMRLPRDAAGYPLWMKRILSDTLGDFCFQLKILSPGGDGAVLSEALNQLAFVPHIKEKISLRVSWFLPFFYGLLGSAVFLMRNLASVRTSAMEWLPVVMRLSLGGVAGIVIGWFSAAASPGVASASTLSVPFALAFLTGYGIDVLFNLLDRLNRAINESPNKSA